MKGHVPTSNSFLTIFVFANIFHFLSLDAIPIKVLDEEESPTSVKLTTTIIYVRQVNRNTLKKTTYLTPCLSYHSFSLIWGDSFDISRFTFAVENM